MHNIISLQQDAFDTRIIFGGCMININGETLECRVEKEKESNFKHPRYTVYDSETGEQLCYFSPYHLSDGPLFYQIDGVSQSGGDATLIVGNQSFLPSSRFNECFGEDEGEEDDGDYRYD